MTAGEMSAVAPPANPSPRRQAAWWLGAAVAGVGVLLLAAWLGGGLATSRLTGLPDAGQLTAVGLPILRLVVDLAGAAAVGGTIFAAFVLPGLDPRGRAPDSAAFVLPGLDKSAGLDHNDAAIGPAGYRLLRLTGPIALVWAIAVVGEIIFTVSDILGEPLGRVTPTAVISFAQTVSQGQALALQAALALVVAIVSRFALSREGGAWAAVAALVGVLPPAFTGHASGAGNHQLAVSSLVVHVLAASLWAGGLIAVLLVRPRRLLAQVGSGFSRLALVCFIAVAVSGVANATVRLGSWSALFHSAYGALVLGKVGAIVALGAIGYLHRRWALGRLAAGRAGAFVQLASGEVVLLAATFGLAVALSRTATPVATEIDNGFDPYTELVGFPQPPPISGTRLLSLPLPDLLILTVIAVLAAAYIAGVLRLWRAGTAWPWWRAASFLGGLVLLGIVTTLGFARYSYVLFSVHMAQHMILTMIVPGLLVPGAPITLALRALREPADPLVRGPRQWLLVLLHSRFMQLVAHPLVALGIYVVGLYALYLSNLFPVLMRSHLGHLAMIAHFVLSGYLLTWVLVGTDPGRRRWSPPLLMLVLFAGMVFHAFFGVALMLTQGIIGASWYDAVHPVWAASLSADQTLGAGIAWAFGEVPAAGMMIALMRQWMAADEREQRRIDRAAARAEADGSEDELARYNAYLRRINGLPPAPALDSEVAGTGADAAATNEA